MNSGDLRDASGHQENRSGLCGFRLPHACATHRASPIATGLSDHVQPRPLGIVAVDTRSQPIDDTAHFLVGYRRRRAGGATPEEAIADCMRLLGRPIVVTSLMLIAGFAVLSFSGFATLREFGHLTAWTMLVCVLADLLLLPAVLLRARV